jgi:hypothetical protein
MDQAISFSQIKSRCLRLMDQVPAPSGSLQARRFMEMLSLRSPPLVGPGVILLDTHVFSLAGSGGLSPWAHQPLADSQGVAGGAVALCAFTFWEVAMLALRGRIGLRQSPESWRLDGLRAG